MSETVHFLNLTNSSKESEDIRREMARNTSEYLKENLGKDDYDRLKQVFFHVCIEDFTYKLLVTRRAYLLYELFCLIFECFPEEYKDIAECKDLVEDPDYKFAPKGRFYDSHSAFLLKNKEFKKNDTLLVVDDIIIHGRSVSEVYKELFKKLGLNIDSDHTSFWCVYLNQNADCVLDEVHNRLTVYRKASTQEWKTVSSIYSSAIINSKRGYTSYIDTYFWKDAKKDAEILFVKSENTDVVKMDLKKLNDLGVDGYVWFGNNTWTGDQPIPDHYSCLRFYFMDNDLVIIPYLFIKHVSLKDAYQYAVALLHEFEIPKMPGNITQDSGADEIILFLKWTINRIGKQLVERFIREKIKQENVTLWVINHKETFKEEFCGNEVNVPDEVKFPEPSNMEYNSEEIFCQNVLNKILKNYKTLCVSDSTAYDTLKEIYTLYSAEIKEEDERRVPEWREGKEKEKGKDRCVGISASDFYQLIVEHFNVSESEQPKLLQMILTILIMHWDVGNASYNLSLAGENKQDVAGLVRNGEQVFQDIYALCPNVYPFFQYFIQRYRASQKKDLRKFGEYLKHFWFAKLQRGALADKKYQRLEQERQRFLISLETNSSCFDDAYVVAGSVLTDEIEQAVNQYMLEQ